MKRRATAAPKKPAPKPEKRRAVGSPPLRLTNPKGALAANFKPQPKRSAK